MAAQRKLHTDLRHKASPVYSYLVSAMGRPQFHGRGTLGAQIVFLGRLAKKDGYERVHEVIVENSVEHPDLVERVAQALHVGTPARMLVSFERTLTRAEDNVSRFSTLARIEEVVAPSGDNRQLTFAL